MEASGLWLSNTQRAIFDVKYDNISSLVPTVPNDENLVFLKAISMVVVCNELLKLCYLCMNWLFFGMYR